MSLKDGKDYLFLIWKSGQSGKQYIVGQLTKNSEYEFKYCEEIKEALEDGFVPLLCFPDLSKVYKDERLFSIFSSRLPDKKRKDIHDILKKYGMEEYDEYMLLKRSGARLPIDGLEFIDPILDASKDQTRLFFVEGVRHNLNCKENDCLNTWEITRGDEVFFKSALENEHNENAVQVTDISGRAIGYVPRYYSKSIVELLQKKSNIKGHVYYVEKGGNCNECIKVIMEIKKQH